MSYRIPSNKPYLVGSELDYIVEAAQGVNARYKGRFLGTLGDLATLSFHETKNCICGEGGVHLINDERLISRAEVIREKGTNRSQFFRGQVDKYNWVDIGWSYLPSDILAAFFYGQLEPVDEIAQRRQHIYSRYLDRLRPLESEGLIRLPYIPDHCDSNYHLFHILLENAEVRASLIDYLKQRGVSAVFHFLPLHLSPVGRRMGGMPDTLPVTEDITERILRLPFFYELDDDGIDFVADSIFAFFGKA